MRPVASDWSERKAQRLLAALSLIGMSGCLGLTTIGYLDAGGTSTGGTTASQTDGSFEGGVGDSCGDPTPGCTTGLDCVNGSCLIPPHSPAFRCDASTNCENNAQGATDCQERICCNVEREPCGVDNDCCTGAVCVRNICRIETAHGFCLQAADCLSNDCGEDTYCACLTAGTPSTSYLQCCSGQLNTAGTACAAPTVGFTCPANECSQKTEQCQGATCCITSTGSEVEPCANDQQCCQSPVALTCYAQTCCNRLNGACQTNDDCCYSHICNASPGETGLCKLNSGISVCRLDADCISNSCDLDAGTCS